MAPKTKARKNLAEKRLRDKSRPDREAGTLAHDIAKGDRRFNYAWRSEEQRQKDAKAQHDSYVNRKNRAKEAKETKEATTTAEKERKSERGCTTMKFAGFF